MFLLKCLCWLSYILATMGVENCHVAVFYQNIPDEILPQEYVGRMVYFSWPRDGSMDCRIGGADGV